MISAPFIGALLVAATVLSAALPSPAAARETAVDAAATDAEAVPEVGSGRMRGAPRTGITLEAGTTYDPTHDISFLLVTAVADYDYGTFWNQDRPSELRFKLEAAAGGTFRPEFRTMASVGMLALYHLDRFRTGDVRPYFEAGIGVIYTDFRVPEQGLRFNFNPQLGLGAEWQGRDGSTMFSTFRLHHLSNGGLHEDNRGVNSFILQLGRYF